MDRGRAGRGRPASRRRRAGGDDADANRWLGTYGDAVTLLMAFFVMLYAMSQIDIVKFEAFVRGLEIPFGNPAVSEGMLDSQPGIVGDTAGEAAPDFLQVRPDPIVVAQPKEDDEQPEVERPQIDAEQLQRVRQAIESSLEAEKLPELAEYRYDERGLVVSIATDDVLFDSGSTRIKPLGRRIIAAVAQPLSQFDNDVFIEGHTDNVPLTRPGYTNWNLSTDRSVAVLSLLYGEFGIDQRRLGAAGYGEFRPQAPNDTRANRARNRRVDILIVAQGA